MKCKTVFIYCLKDPTTGDVRYIGQTKNPKKRLSQHLNRSIKKKNHLGFWLKTLVARQERPVLAVLHEVTREESWAEEERRYISCARALGIDLVNSTDGGEGGPMSREHHDAAIKRCAALSAAKRGVPTGPRSPGTRAAISAALKGVPKSPKHRAAMSAALKGVPRGPRSPEHCAAISAAKKGVPIGPSPRKGVPKGPSSLETRAAQSAALKGVPWSPARRAAYERRWGTK